MIHPLLYELNTRCWLRRLSEQSGQPITLGNAPESELDRWSSWGLTHLWLMGVWSTGPRARELALTQPHQRRVYDEVLPGWQPTDVGGSPYAIADYHPASALGGDDDLARFRKRLRSRSIRLILDFVPNHLGLDHAWARQFPDLFVQSPGARPGTFLEPTVADPRWMAHGKDPYFPPWTDTVQVDYRLEAARAAMSRLLETIAARCDGVRCDMAMLLLEEVFAKTWRDFPPAGILAAAGEEFWEKAIRNLKRQHPDFEFLAEAYWGLEPRLQDLGFDYTYDKELYDKLLARDGAEVQRHLSAMPAARLSAGIHFLENHDEQRAAAALLPAEHEAAALLILGLPGMRLLHEGQMEGHRLRLPVQLVRGPAEPRQPFIEGIYDRLLKALRVSAVGRGKAELLAVQPIGDSPRAPLVLVQWKAKPGVIDLVAVNLSPHPVKFQAPLRLGEPRTEEDWRVTDLLGDFEGRYPEEELRQRGLGLVLRSHGAALYHCQAGGALGP